MFVFCRAFVAGDEDVEWDCGAVAQSRSCGLWGFTVGSFGRGRRHQLSVWVRWAFPVLCVDSLSRAVQKLQEDFLSDGFLDAFTHSWREKQAQTRGRKSTQREAPPRFSCHAKLMFVSDKNTQPPH